MEHIDFITAPDIILLQTEQEWVKLDKSGEGLWIHNDIELRAESLKDKLDIYLIARDTPIKRIIARRKCSIDSKVRILGDHWERSYGESEWRGIVPERILPWYFLISDGRITHGYGVKTGPNAMCFWQVSESDITLCMDVRCGGKGVILSGKKLHVASIVNRTGNAGESPFASAKAFCAVMCEKPKLPGFPVYGGNNWYYAYGKSDHNQILEDSKRISDLAFSNNNRPFMVIDACWQ